MLVNELRNDILNCHKCSLCDDKSNKVVFGKKGINFKPNTNIFVVGEASGKEEAIQGKPFVGRSGELLDSWLKVFAPDNDYFISNIVKNRPPENRPPIKEEIDACLPYLIRQIDIIKPKKILLLGPTVFNSFFSYIKNIDGSNVNDTITSSLGKEYVMKCSFGNVAIYTYLHPNYILRNQNRNWQKEIDELATRILGKDSKHGMETYKYAGLSNFEKLKEIEAQEVDSKKFENMPMIGVKTDYSFMQFGGKFHNEMVYLKKNSAKVIGICDENSVSGFIKFNDFADLTKIKPIFGTKLLVGDFKNNFSFALFILNFNGFVNLNKIITYLNMNNPSSDELVKYVIEHKDGLVCVIPSSSFSAKYFSLYKLISISLDTYIGYVPIENPYNKIKFEYLLNNLNCKPIIFQDNYFVEKKDHNVYLIISCIKRHKKISEIDNTINSDSYLKSLDEIKLLMPDTYEIICQNTIDFSNRFNFHIEKGHNILPAVKYNFGFEVNDDDIVNFRNEFKLLDNIDNEKAKKFASFWKLVNKKDLSQNIVDYAKNNNISVENAKIVYKDRIRLELESLFSKDFIDYILLVKGIYDFVEEKNYIYGSGRGSSSGSLVLYCLGIVKVDALLNGLIFERFINLYRADLPDIDCDFETGHRKEIIKYLIDTYGSEKVFHCGTVLTFKDKSTLNEVAKVLNIPKYVIEDINSFLVKRSAGDARSGHIIEETFSIFPELNKYKEKYPEFFEMVKGIEGMKRTSGTDASSIMILDKEYYNYFPLNCKNEITRSGLDFHELEPYGLVKMDILGINTFDIISKVIKKNNIVLNYEKPDGIGHDYKPVFELFKNRWTAGLFEVKTPAMSTLGAAIVDNFDDIIALNGICRPAGMRYNMNGKYLEFKKTKKQYSYGEKVDTVLDKFDIFKKYGSLLLWQEQLMLVFTHIGNFYMVDSNAVVKAVSKSKGVITFFNEFGEKFVSGAMNNGLDEKEAKNLFNQMFQFGSFAFNLAHSTAYGYNIYYTAYLKAKYPIDYYIASLNTLNESEVGTIKSELMRRGYKVVSPDINKSDGNSYKFDNNEFIPPLSEIKYLSQKQIDLIIAGRPWNSIEQMIDKLKITKRVADSIMLVQVDDNRLPLIDILKKPINNPNFLNNRFDEITKLVSDKYNVKLNLLSEHLLNKEVWIVVQLVGKPKTASWGDWLKEKSMPTEKQMEENASVYKGIKEYGWMARWCKLSIKDLHGFDGFVNVKPDIYAKHFSEISKLKPYSIFLAKLKMGRNISSRQTLLDIKLME